MVAELICEVIPLVFKIFILIQQAAAQVKILPELANRLKVRALAFEGRLNEIQRDNSPHLARPVQDFYFAARDVHLFLLKLSRSSFRMVVAHKSLVSEYQALTVRLDEARNELQFHVILDQRIEKQAYEDDLVRLLELSLAEHRSQGSKMLDLKRVVTDLVLAIQGSNDKEVEENSVVDTAALLLLKDDPVAAMVALREEEVESLLIASSEIEKLRAIAQGGFATVYMGRHRNAEVALKLLRRGDPGALTDERHLIDEVRTHAKCQSDCVARMFGYCRLNDGIYAVIEYSRVGSLDDLLSLSKGRHGGVQFGEESATFEVSAVLNMLCEIAKGLEFVHSRCVVHRDIKPRNILLTDKLLPKLTDFGLARFLSGESTRLLTGGIGTFDYMAPELFQEVHERGGTFARYSYSADIYSFGVVIVDFCHSLYGGGRSMPKTIDLPAEFPPPLSVTKNICLDTKPRNRFGRGTDNGLMVSTAITALWEDTNKGKFLLSLKDGRLSALSEKHICKIASLAAQRRQAKMTDSTYVAALAETATANSNFLDESSITTPATKEELDHDVDEQETHHDINEPTPSRYELACSNEQTSSVWTRYGRRTSLFTLLAATVSGLIVYFVFKSVGNKGGSESIPLESLNPPAIGPAVAPHASASSSVSPFSLAFGPTSAPQIFSGPVGDYRNACYDPLGILYKGPSNVECAPCEGGNITCTFDPDCTTVDGCTTLVQTWSFGSSGAFEALYSCFSCSENSNCGDTLCVEVKHPQDDTPYCGVYFLSSPEEFCSACEICPNGGVIFHECFNEATSECTVEVITLDPFTIAAPTAAAR